MSKLQSSNVEWDCAVIGHWHLAFVTAACLSELGHRVVLVHPGSRLAKPWSGFPELDLNEPGLAEMIARNRAAGRLDAVSQLNDLGNTRYLWLAVDTPVNERDEADLDCLRDLGDRIVQSKLKPQIVMVSSQVPLGFCAEMQGRLNLPIACIPENLRLGKGIETFLNADRTVIGADDPKVRQETREFLSGLKTQFFACDLVTAEMIKHATNAFLATSISFSNELARIGEQYGVDGVALGQGLKLDSRIGKQAYVIPGLGFAGGTLPRDLRFLQKLGKEKGIPTSLVNSVLEVNAATTAAIAESLKNYLGSLRGQRILLLGYSYKADIDTLRRSPTVELAHELKSAGAELFGYDPVMNDRDIRELEGLLEHQRDWSKIPKSLDAAVLMTARPLFRDLNWQPAQRRVSENNAALLLDTIQLGIADPAKAGGWAYKALWRPVVRPL